MSLKYEVYRDKNNAIQYHRHGKLHRKNLPALLYNNGAMFWYQYNGLHREDGAAVHLASGEERYFIRSEEYYKREYEFKIRSFLCR